LQHPVIQHVRIALEEESISLDRYNCSLSRTCSTANSILPSALRIRPGAILDRFLLAFVTVSPKKVGHLLFQRFLRRQLQKLAGRLLTVLVAALQNHQFGTRMT
jgi:hypothetical protein